MQPDIEHLRHLALRYAEAAAHPRNRENERLYRAVNGLRMIRPVVLIDEQPWSELNVDDALELHCQDPFYRQYELYLRKKLFQWSHHPADMILLPYIPVQKMIGGESGGMPVQETTLATDQDNNIVSHEYIDQLENESDIAKIRMPRLTYERTETAAARDRIAEAFGDIVPVRITGHGCYISQWDKIAVYRGVTSLLMDLAERPEHTHAIMERVTQMYIEQYRQYEELGLLEADLPLIHCTAGYCDDLNVPAGAPVLRQNVWGRCMAQIFASVSPAMHEEFEIEYQKRTMEPFGLVYYGCCEPLDRKIDIVRKIPHLRKISITPWANVHVAAEAIGKDYVMAIKPNPAHVSGPFDASVVRREIKEILDACYRNGCSCDIVLKDISTVGHRPENLLLWEQTVMEMVKSH
ncbi:MAG: hypothetical protein SCM11_07100 [Bacillota bacterium]|nr:hypothetical protein [Bacillota bacterium]